MKKGAMELSIGTIVIVVLAMSMLILGIVLIKNIFSGSIDVADMTTAQLKNQVTTLFGENKKLVVYPDSGQINLRQGNTEGFGIGIKNLLQGNADPVKFSYDVVVADPDLRKKCGIGDREAEDYIVTGRADSNFNIAPGDLYVAKVLLSIPEGSPLCTLRYRVNVKANGQAYASEYMDITIKAK